MTPQASLPFLLYQSAQLAAYSDRLTHGFTGKPLSLGGPALNPEERLAQRRLLCEKTGLNAECLVVPEQTHSANIQLNTADGFCQTDAIIVAEPGIPALVQTADCVPLILYAPDRHVGAVIHAGWRGTAQSITALTAQRLFGEFNCKPAALVAVIGPAIGGCCYEVSDEVVDTVSATVDSSKTGFVMLNADQRPQIDLKVVNRLQLEALGVRKIEILPDCTRCETERLWSYRRGEAGRQGAFLELRPLPEAL